MMTPLGKAIRQARIDNDMLLLHMAEKINEPVVFCSKIEFGKEEPTQEYINKLYKLDFSLDNKKKIMVEFDKQRFSKHTLITDKELQELLSDKIIEGDKECEHEFIIVAFSDGKDEKGNFGKQKVRCEKCGYSYWSDKIRRQANED